jgi:hypothetical protein
MMTEGVVLGHRIILGRWIEVYRAKVEAIEKLSYPRDIRGIRSFLGYEGFGRRFIKDFSKVSKHLSNHLQNTTRDLLIASRLITGESILHSLGVTNFRPTALYPRQICLCAPGIVEIPPVNRPPIRGDRTDQAHTERVGPYSPLPPANRPEMRRG